MEIKMPHKELIQTEEATPSFVQATPLDVDIQVRTAKQYPRDVTLCIDEATALATSSPDVAQSCFYVIPMKGGDVTGPSVRLAEIIASCWGNLYVATRIIESNPYKVTAEACCWDLEKNLRIGTQVKRPITLRGGSGQALIENAALSIALRNAIFKVIPRTFVDNIYQACRSAIFEKCSPADFEKKRETVFQKLIQRGVDLQSIFNHFKKESIKEFTHDDVMDLIGVGTAIKDGTLKAQDAFRNGDNNASESLADELEEIMNDERKENESITK
jgi:hypothetical protein